MRFQSHVRPWPCSHAGMENDFHSHRPLVALLMASLRIKMSWQETRMWAHTLHVTCSHVHMLVNSHVVCTRDHHPLHARRLYNAYMHKLIKSMAASCCWDSCNVTIFDTNIHTLMLHVLSARFESHSNTHPACGVNTYYVCMRCLFETKHLLFYSLHIPPLASHCS